MKLNTQDPTATFDWPDDWPQPTKGANASPMLDEVAFAALKADIEKNGLHDYIHFTKSGKIAKGRNRYRALRELGKSHDDIAVTFLRALSAPSALSHHPDHREEQPATDPAAHRRACGR